MPNTQELADINERGRQQHERKLRAVEREAGEMANQVANELEGEVDDAVKVELNSRIPALMRKGDEGEGQEKP